MERRSQKVTRNRAGVVFVIGLSLYIMGISGKINATTLTTPAIQVGPLTHSYYVERYYYPEPPFEVITTSIWDNWELQQDGPSFTPDLSFIDYLMDNYYDSVAVSFTAGQDKKFVVNPPVGIDTWIYARALFSIYTYGEPSLTLLPDSVSATLKGPSGETVMTMSIPSNMFYVGDDPLGGYGCGYGESIVVQAVLPIPQHLEFSSIELTCHYNVWPMELVLDDGFGDPYILRAGGLLTSIHFGGTYEGEYSDYGQIVSIVPIPEPGAVLLLCFGGLTLLKKRKI